MKEQPITYKSERVILESPFSFTGATKRIWPLTRGSDDENIRRFILIPSVVVLLWFIYSGILVWYAIFGIFLVPYRLIRRSHRKRELQSIQHREMLEAISKQRAH